MTRLSISGTCSLCAVVLASCGGPVPPTTSAVLPEATWSVYDLTTNEMPALTANPQNSNEFTTSLPGAHAFYAELSAHASGGIGTIAVTGDLIDVQCGYDLITVGGKPPRPTVSSVFVGPPVNRGILPVGDGFVGGQVSQNAEVWVDFNQAMAVTRSQDYDRQVCPASFTGPHRTRQPSGPWPGVTFSGTIKLYGTVKASQAPLYKNLMLNIHVTPK